MKRIVAVLVAALALSLPAASAGEDAPSMADLQERVAALEKANAARKFKVGIVSEGEVFDNLEEKKDIDVDIELIGKESEKTIAAIRKECDDLETEIKFHPEGSEERRAKMKLFEKKKHEMALKYNELKDIMQRQANKMLDQMRMKIRLHIAHYAREHGYTLVIERSALLYGEEGENLTTEIIDRMNTEYFKLEYGEKE
ncbi:MAG: OmpH family outer membrane protein [Planctomycetes bacterium]|nr:OmpH family outer membrane protein [Planctomycetota bacterium]